MKNAFRVTNVKRAFAIVHCVLLVGLLVASMLAPWWTASVTHPAFFNGLTASARPFDDHALAHANGVLTSGVLLVLAGIAAWTTAFMFFAQPIPLRAAAVTMATAALFAGLAAGLAPATWPPGDASFWSGGNSNGYTLDAWVNVGWYLAVATCLLALYSAIHIAVAARRAAAVHAASQGQTATSSIS